MPAACRTLSTLPTCSAQTRWVTPRRRPVRGQWSNTVPPPPPVTTPPAPVLAVAASSHDAGLVGSRARSSPQRAHLLPATSRAMWRNVGSSRRLCWNGFLGVSPSAAPEAPGRALGTHRGGVPLELRHHGGVVGGWERVRGSRTGRGEVPAAVRRPFVSASPKPRRGPLGWGGRGRYARAKRFSGPRGGGGGARAGRVGESGSPSPPLPGGRAGPGRAGPARAEGGGRTETSKLRLEGSGLGSGLGSSTPPRWQQRWWGPGPVAWRRSTPASSSSVAVTWPN